MPPGPACRPNLDRLRLQARRELPVQLASRTPARPILGTVLTSPTNALLPALADTQPPPRPPQQRRRCPNNAGCHPGSIPRLQIVYKRPPLVARPVPLRMTPATASTRSAANSASRARGSPHTLLRPDRSAKLRRPEMRRPEPADLCLGPLTIASAVTVPSRKAGIRVSAGQGSLAQFVAHSPPVRGRSPAAAGRLSGLVMNAGGRW